MSFEKMSVVNIAMESLKNQGFENIKAIDPETSDVPVSKPIFVTDLDGASNFIIVPLDATATKEFQDFIYVAIKVETNELLEAVSISKAPRIYNDQEMESKLQEKFPRTSCEIMPKYFWKSTFRSFLTTARCSKIDGKEHFLLPNGTIISSTEM